MTHFQMNIKKKCLCDGISDRQCAKQNYLIMMALLDVSMSLTSNLVKTHFFTATEFYSCNRVQYRQYILLSFGNRDRDSFLDIDAIQ